MSVGGIMQMEGNASIEARRAAAEQTNNQPVVQGLAAHVRGCWQSALDAKRLIVEERMLQCMRQRRGEYDPERLSEIRKMGGSEIYMMLTSNKCRSAASWIRDVMMGTKNEKPWTIAPSPQADLPPQVAQSVQNQALQEAQAFTQATGLPVGPEYIARDAAALYDRVQANAKVQAAERMERMEVKMEDQLAEGGFHDAMSEFINDIATFPAAVIKGPIVRRKRKLKWVPSPTPDNPYNVVAKAEDYLCLEWARVDPFMVYPAAHATNVDDGDFIERHKLSRSALLELKGVPGYSDAAIDAVLDQYGRGGLNEWLYIDSAKAEAEGKSVAAIGSNPGKLIDALQFWGSVQGKMLVEWGMPEASVPDQLKEYPCEVWLIGSWVIKATLNPDPLARKPYYKASYEEVPGTFWGNGVPDLCRDSQAQCNVAARAIANNMGIASGPQVAYNTDRLPPGEDLTQLYPWKIHQFTSDPYGSTAKAVEFFAPPIISGELMQVYRFFSEMADEHTGIPRYMTGDAQGQGGALRTSSGMSMLMQNAGKSIKQVIANIDLNVIEPLIERLWFYNMMFGTDPSLKGDIHVVARGANSLVVKETQQQRINEFLQLALTNPLVNQIVGEEAIAAMLRIAAKNLDMDTDQIVPRPEVIRARVAQASQAAQAEKDRNEKLQLAIAGAPSQKLHLEVGPDGQLTGGTVDNEQMHVMSAPPGAPVVPPGLMGVLGETMGGPPGGSAPAPKTMPTQQPGAVTAFAPPRRLH
jgi:hypothetical protein